MADDTHVGGASARVDFAATGASGPLIFEDRLHVGAITLARCLAPPNPNGGCIVSPQTHVVVPTGPAFDLDWRANTSDRTRSSTISRGRVMLYEANAPVWKRWTASPSIFVLAIAPEFIDDIRRRSLEPSNGNKLRTFVGFEDPVADNLIRLAERELRDGGTRGRLYVEGLASALVVHLLQTYGGEKPAERHAGGLAPAQLRRVVDYVSAHLADELALGDLAALAGLSPHHFGDAFKTATGVAPYQYVIERRVERAGELLRDVRQTVAEVAIAVGFSSQSHLTRHFRRITGETPARFRRSQVEISNR